MKLSTLAVPVTQLTQDHAAAVVDLIDRNRMSCDSETYDDLLMIASGHGELVRSAAEGRTQVKPHALCVVCGKGFDALRPNAARYCSDVCKSKAARKRHANVSKTGSGHQTMGAA